MDFTFERPLHCVCGGGRVGRHTEVGALQWSRWLVLVALTRQVAEKREILRDGDDSISWCLAVGGETGISGDEGEVREVPILGADPALAGL